MIEEVVVESLSRWWLREVVTSSRSVVTKVLGVGACGYQRPRGHQGEMKQGMRTTPERRQKDARKEIAVWRIRGRQKREENRNTRSGEIMPVVQCGNTIAL